MPHYPDCSPDQDVEGFLTLEAQDLDETIAEAEHPAQGHRIARLDRCNRLALIAEQTGFSDLLARITEHRDAIVVEELK